jgi:TatD DNase family protein
MLIDSHAHLEMKEFDSDREEVIRRARKEGINYIITVGTNLFFSRKAVSLAHQYENIYAAIGVHPHDVAKTSNKTFDNLRLLASEKKVIAYGEIGLDFFRNVSPYEKQFEMFNQQLELVKELNLPVIIHDREAHKEILQMVKASGLRHGVFHCFSGDYNMAKECMDLGFYISVPGVVTFNKADKMHNVVRHIPLDFLLLETDCPYLAPVPHRGKRNEPSFIIHTAKKVAEIKGMDWEDVAQKTTLNTKKLFRLEYLRD